MNEINLDAFIAEEGSFRIDIYDLVGKKVSSKEVYLDYGPNTIKVDFDQMTSGSYVVEMVDLKTNERVKKKFARTN